MTVTYWKRASLTLAVVLASSHANAQPPPPASDAPAPAPAPAPTAEPPAPAPARVDGDDVHERLREAERRLDKIEKASALQRIQWGAEYRTIVSSHWYHGPSPDGARGPDGQPKLVDLSNGEQWLHRVRLNLRAEPIESIRFTGRLTMFKRFGSNTATPFPQDSSETRIPQDNGVRFERAWLDWFIRPWLALSVGRISYTDGPPAELRENRAQLDATWGQQMVDGEYDTADLTVRLGNHLLVRGFYASWAFPRTDDLFSNYLFLNNGTDNLRIVGGNVDLRLDELGKLFVQLGAYHVPEFRPFDVPIPSPTPAPNPTNAPAPFNGGYLFPSSKPSSLGKYTNLSVLVTYKDIASSGLDLFASGAVGFLDPNNQGIAYPIGPGGAPVPLLALSSADSTDHTTFFAFTGMRYTMPFGEEIAPKVGFEFNYGSRYMISFSSPTSTLTNKLANRGEAYEAYVIQPVNERLFFRLSYSLIQTRYTGGFFGPSANFVPQFGGTAPAVDQHLHSLALILNATF
jgi:hypothetical protein